MKSLSAILSLGLVAAAFQVNAQVEEDREAIKSQCGCHEIDFNFAETFPHQEGYELHDSYHAHADAEWIFVDEESEDKIVIQHILIVNGEIIVKHWREDWIYENRDIHEFEGNLTWKYIRLAMEDVQGQWTQKVYQVSDAPRYQASATWIHEDDRHYWESTTNAPLPRREYTKRHDYQIIKRTNHHEIVENGYNHDQQNVKTQVTEEGEVPLVDEVGHNEYRKVEQSDCQVAIDWWEENKEYWRVVRNCWEEVLVPGADISIALVVDDKMLQESLNELAEEMKGEDEEDIREEVLDLLNDFVTATPKENTESES